MSLTLLFPSSSQRLPYALLTRKSFGSWSGYRDSSRLLNCSRLAGLDADGAQVTGGEPCLHAGPARHYRVFKYSPAGLGLQGLRDSLDRMLTERLNAGS